MQDPIRVVVVGDPGGDHPEWVRQAWLGVEFNAIPHGDNVIGTEVISGARVVMERAWIVNVSEAIAALEAASKDQAAAWWRSMGYPKAHEEWLFEFKSCVPAGGGEIIFPSLN